MKKLLLILLPLAIVCLGGCTNKGLKANCTDTFGSYWEGCIIVYEKGDMFVISGGTTMYYTGEYLVPAEGSSPGVMSVRYKEQYNITGGENIAYKQECVIQEPPRKRRKTMIRNHKYMTRE